MRNSFIFYVSYYDAVKTLPDEEQGEMYRVLIEYAMTEVIPTLEGIKKAIFLLVKPVIDKGIRLWKNGSLGGAPKGNKNAQKVVRETTYKQPKNNLETTKNQPINNLETTKNQPDISRYNIKDNNQDNILVHELEQEKELEIENELDDGKPSVHQLNRSLTEEDLKQLFPILKLSRPITDEDIEYYLTWSSSWKISKELILYCAELSAGKNNSMQYLNKVLLNMKVKNIFAISDLHKLDNASKDNFIHNNYTHEQIASFISDLDNVEV